MADDARIHGLEALLAEAATDPVLAAALIARDLPQLRTLGVSLTRVEEQMLAATKRSSLTQMAAQVERRLRGVSRRAFLKTEAAVGTALASVALGSCESKDSERLSPVLEQRLERLAASGAELREKPPLAPPAKAKRPRPVKKLKMRRYGDDPKMPLKILTGIRPNRWRQRDDQWRDQDDRWRDQDE